MKRLLDTTNQNVLPYPRIDDLTVQGLDTERYKVLAVVDTAPPEFNPDTQWLSFSYQVFESELEYRQVWAVNNKIFTFDWDGLKNRALSGDLHSIFERLTIASLASDANTISTARGDITDAILTVRIEAALASGFQLLTQIGGYQFTQEEKDLWQSAVDELHFSPLIYLP